MENEINLIEQLALERTKNDFWNKEYIKLKSNCDKLEDELMQARSQIKSMRITLTYSDSYNMRKETDMREEIEMLKQVIKKKTEKKKRKEASLTREIESKSQYIDNLIEKLEKLYADLERYQDELFKYQDEYSKTKTQLENEMHSKQKIQMTHQNTCKELVSLQDNFSKLNMQIENYKIEKEQMLKDIIEKVESRSAKEIEKIREMHLKEKNEFIQRQVDNIRKIEESHALDMSTFKKFTEVKIREIKQYYEERVASLINEVSFAEGKHLAELNYLKSCIENLEKERTYLSQLNAFLTNKTEENQELQQELQQKIESLIEQDKTELRNTQIFATKKGIDLQYAKARYEETSQMIVQEYEKRLKICQKSKEDEIRFVQHRYEENIKKLKKIPEEHNLKEKKHYEIQIECLLQKVEEIEKQRSELECKLIEKSHTEHVELVEVFSN